MAALIPAWAIGESPHRLHPVRVDEDVGALRRDVTALTARRATVRPGEVALVATEMGTNILRHASGGGYVLYREVGGGVELIAVDRGPGMAARGASPARGLGVGLQGIRNLATSFDLYTASPGGTVVLARVLPGRPAATWYRFGAVNVGVGDDGESGDRWAVESNGVLAALVVDGLGHGAAAAEAARAAVRVFDSSVADDLPSFLQRAHDAMRGTRGGVLAAAVVDASAGEMTFAGVGNVVARIVSGERRSSMISREGVIGTETALRLSDPLRRSWAAGDILVMSSDGLRAQWDLSEYPGLAHRDPTVMAAVLHRDHGRTNDDVTVLVVSDDRDRGRVGRE